MALSVEEVLQRYLEGVWSTRMAAIELGLTYHDFLDLLH